MLSSVSLSVTVLRRDTKREGSSSIVVENSNPFKTGSITFRSPREKNSRTSFASRLSLEAFVSLREQNSNTASEKASGINSNPVVASLLKGSALAGRVTDSV
eukprot:Blabericola_migrator_1__1981@NODE_153_length_12753_cov_114_743891_g134_i0_p9_GENE_NODE_153_length_12753_cov_114_743891_g134_i0NODE_153_length_12753_cov_114_743891_g134_i0_p9_ORF_typecomplete_len102_score13_31_NODE_153_length_12753_cov_114_743891_g134_i01033810643